MPFIYKSDVERFIWEGGRVPYGDIPESIHISLSKNNQKFYADVDPDYDTFQSGVTAYSEPRRPSSRSLKVPPTDPCSGPPCPAIYIMIEEETMKTARLSRTLAMLLPLAALAAPAPALAQDAYPARPIRLIIPFAAGGGADVVGRLIATRLSERLGRQVVVDNRTGAGGVIGTDLVARGAPDGYTLGFVPASFTMQPALQKLPYDPIKSFTPVARVGKGSFVLVVTPAVPAKTLKEFIAYAKQNPGKMFFGTAGAGSTAHMFLELFKMMADINFNVVHFKGGNQQVIDLLGGHSHGTMISLPAVRPHIIAGKLQALATSASKRTVFLPDVPTFDEAGVKGYDAIVWWGVLAPTGTPAAVVSRLDAELKSVLAQDEVNKAFAGQGVEPDYQGPFEFRPFIAAEIANWTSVVKKGNIKLE